MGGNADGDAGCAQRLDLVEIGGDRRLAHPVEPAALVGDVEQHDRDPGLGRRLGRRERLGGAEVVELAHGRVPGGAHLPVHLGVVRPHRRRASPRSASSSIPSRHVQKSVPAARPRSARWKAWLWLLTKPGSGSEAATTDDATTSYASLAEPRRLARHEPRPSPRPCGRSRTR